MCKKSIMFLLSALTVFAVSVLCVSAECQHDFSPSDFNTNLIVNDDMSHSYFCRNGCGAYGTVSGGEKGKEPCTLVIVSQTEPDCISEGKKIYACRVCFSNKIEVVDKIQHSYSAVRTFPTCTQQGYDTHTCTVCKDSYRDNYTEKLKHIADGGVIEVLPTYEKEGLCKVSCRMCGALLESKSLSRFFREEELHSYTAKVNNLKSMKSSTSAVKLVWDRAKGADLYKVSFSADKKKWNVRTTDRLYITLKGLSASQLYYFKVTPFSNGAEGEESEVFSVCTKPEKVVLTKVKSAKKSTAALKWKKQNGVSGYEISYTADSFKKKKTVKTVSVTKGTSKTLRKLKSGKRYYFRVRAYKKSGSLKIFGAYSKTKSIRIK